MSITHLGPVMCLCEPVQEALGANDITADFGASKFHLLPVGTAAGSMPKKRAERSAWLSENYVKPRNEKLKLQVSRRPWEGGGASGRGPERGRGQSRRCRH